MVSTSDGLMSGAGKSMLLLAHPSGQTHCPSVTTPPAQCLHAVDRPGHDTVGCLVLWLLLLLRRLLELWGLLLLQPARPCSLTSRGSWALLLLLLLLVAERPL